MTPEIIDEIIKKNFPSLLAKPRTNPDGWSYYLGPSVKTGKDSNRILRAVSRHPNQDAQLKLSISARIKGREDFTFVSSEEVLVSIIADEIDLYKQSVTP